MKKLDIMNMRAGEEWIIKDGKEFRCEKNIIVTDSVMKMPVKENIKPIVKTELKKVVKNGK